MSKKPYKELYKLTPGDYLIEIDAVKVTDAVIDALRIIFKMLAEKDIFIHAIIGEPGTLKFIPLVKKKAK